MNKEWIDQTIQYVKEELSDAEGGHDWLHIERVYRNAMLIANEEDVDHEIVALGALLHDIADAKFYDGDEEVGPRMAKEFLAKLGVNSAITEHVVQIIKNISFKNQLDDSADDRFDSLELRVIRDADRLDAIGAIGIARCFNYGGFKNRKLYDKNIAPQYNMTKEEYKNSEGPTLNHFYEKLLLLKGMMHTDTGRKLAEKRHKVMLDFLEEFKKETGFSI